jgi:hypothetical protein
MAFASQRGLKAELRDKPILYFVLGCFVFETGMNAIFGYRQAGGGFSPAALLYGFIFICLAVLGAWACVELFAVKGDGGAANWRRFAYAVPFIGCLAVSQFSGWGVLGVTLADGGAKREVAATKSALAGETLAQLRAERAAIGVPRTIDAINAELNLELRKTSRQYPDGDGPKAMRLKAELATAERAHALDQEIQTAMKDLETAPAVAGGNPEFSVVQGWTGAAPADVRKWFSVFLVALVGFFANFGFALAGVGQDRGPDRKTAAFLERFDLGPKALPGGGSAQTLYDELVERFGRDAVEAHLPGLAVRADAPSGSEAWASEARQQYARIPPPPEEVPTYQPKPLGGHPPPFPPSIDVRTPAAAPVQHGAPIAIHNHFAGGAPQPHAVGQAPASPPPPIERDAGSVPGTERHAAGRSSQGAAPRQLPPLLTGPPVDRSTANRRQDHLMTFRQARLEVCPGALVSADDMYACYAAWAGERRMSQAAFNVLLSELADVPQETVAGHLHFYDFAIRTTVPRQARA